MILKKGEVQKVRDANGQTEKRQLRFTLALTGKQKFRRRATAFIGLIFIG